MQLDTPITYLKGVGPQRAKVLESKGIATVEDLLYYMPFRYEDRSNVKRIADLAPGETATVVGRISGSQLYHPRRSRLRVFEVRVSDGSGRPLV
jgi:ATP-dependent DNA helicase RecG